mgnify:CR=1 FL=1
MTIKIVKTESLRNEFRRKATKTSVVLEALKDLNPGESVLISAKEADRWKVPANALRSTITYGYKSNVLSKKNKYTVKCLKSGSYAINRISA